MLSAGPVLDGAAGIEVFGFAVNFDAREIGARPSPAGAGRVADISDHVVRACGARRRLYSLNLDFSHLTIGDSFETPFDSSPLDQTGRYRRFHSQSAGARIAAGRTTPRSGARARMYRWPASPIRRNPLLHRDLTGWDCSPAEDVVERSAALRFGDFLVWNQSAGIPGIRAGAGLAVSVPAGAAFGRRPCGGFL